MNNQNHNLAAGRSQLVVRVLDKRPATPTTGGTLFTSPNGVLEDVVETRFWSRVDRSGSCWVWTGSQQKYGVFTVAGKRHYAHRLAYQLCVGPIPQGKVLLHSCDNPLCVNPAHLTVGTDRDNIHDAIRKGRFKHHRKLTPAQAAEIKAALAAGTSQTELATRYGVTYHAIRSIAIGRTWRADSPNFNAGAGTNA